MKKHIIVISLFLLSAVFFTACRSNKPLPTPPALPSWQDQDAKSAVLNYVSQISRSGKTSIPSNMRIAVLEFDEFFFSPTTADLKKEFIIYGMEKIVQESPYLADKTPYKEILAREPEYNNENAIKKYMYLAMMIFNDMPLNQYRKEVAIFLQKYAKEHGKSSIRELINKPATELIDYLHKNNFDTYVVADCDVELVRSFCEGALSLSPEFIIGETVSYKYNDSTKQLLRTMKSNELLEGNIAGTIEQRLGRKPLITLVSSEKELAAVEYKPDFYIERLSMIFTNNPSDSLKIKAEEKGWIIFDK